MRTIGIIVVAALGLVSPAAGQVPDPLSTGARALEKADYPEARKWYGIAADQGNPITQASLGYIYEHGLGVVRDDAEAVPWYQLVLLRHNLSCLV